MNTIRPEFLHDLFKLCLTHKSVMDVVLDNLKFEYLPHEKPEYKKLYEKITHLYKLELVIPTFGTLSQIFHTEDDVLKLLYKIKETKVDLEQRDSVLNELEQFILKNKVSNYVTAIANMYNEKKLDQAVKFLTKEAENISNFNIKSNYYSNVFNQFGERQIERAKRDEDIYESKVPFSIHELDYYTNGGMDLGTSTLVLAQSGKGKSTMMRWVAMSAARLGFRVVHFSCEDTERNIMTYYDAGWTSIDTRTMDSGFIPEEKSDLIKKALGDIKKRKGDIHVKCSDSFDKGLTIDECRDIVVDVEKNYGKVHLVLFDYLEIFEVKTKFGTNDGAERRKREHIINKITSIATTLNVACLVATQASDVKIEKKNDPSFVMTRSDISEFKGALKPVSYFITLNQTEDEYNQGICRIYCDKFRKYMAGQTIYIYQSMYNSRFYNSDKTLKVFWDNGNKCKLIEPETSKK